MGVKVESSEIIIKFIIYYLIVSASCDIKLITCDIHQMIQSYYNNSRNRSNDGVMDIDTTADFKINATELQQHIMNGLNMRTKPDASLANISQDEYFTKYQEYLNKVNSRKKRSKKLYGDDITRTVFDEDEESETFKKIFAFKYSNQSNSSAHRRRRRSIDEDVTMLSFEISDKKDLPTVVEEATLNVFLSNSKDFTSSPQVISKSETETESIDDDSSSSSHDISPKKYIIKSNRHSSKSHQIHIRHSDSNRKQHSNRNKLQFTSHSQMLRLHVYQHESRNGRIFLFHKDITLPIYSNSDEKKFTYNKWIQLDLTSIVRTWLQGNEKELNIDIHCEQCSKFGIYIVNEASQSNKFSSTEGTTHNPALNVIGAVVRSKRKTPHNKKVRSEDAKHKKTHCRHNGDKKCCRHKWTIDFKELGGYDYIIQPRHFDAGFCDGTCPFRHNMGSNHAYFQSLAHHQLKKEDVPNVCCAPTRLQDLEILHIDENDHTKLKVTTMKKMRAMKCSCT